MAYKRSRRSGAALLSAAALAGAAVALSACTSQLADLPVVGLPKDAPERPAEPMAVPAVHDMPEPRATRPMTNDELRRAAAELEAARDQQQGRPPPSAPKKTATPARTNTESAGTPRDP
jgi:hypothetical protein